MKKSKQENIMKKELFSKHVLIDETRSIGVVEMPHGIAIEGTTYNPETNETLTQRIFFTVEAGLEIAKTLREWRMHKKHG